MYDELVKQINQLVERKKPIIVAISGYGGSGKSHLADRLAKHFGVSEEQILHMDYLHSKPAKHKNEDDIFGDHDWPLIYRVLNEVCKGKRLRYKSRGLWGHSRKFDEPAPRVLIIEGVRLLRKELLNYVDVAVWIDAPVGFVTERAKTRDREMGQDEAHIRRWDEEWVPRNDKYFNEVHPDKLANFIFTEIF